MAAWQTAGAAEPLPPPTLTACAPATLTGHAPDAEEVGAHRQQALPGIHYEYGRRPDAGRWGVLLTLAVDASGRVTCYGMKDEYGKDQPLNPERRGLLEQVKDWRYTPFAQAGKPAAAIVVEHIAEDELPRKHLPLPEAPLASVRFKLEREGCLTFCPDYEVEIAGDGHVVYQGEDFVDVQGEHRYEIPQDDVARLVEKLRTADLWSLREDYVAAVDDAPAYTLTMRIGSSVHRILDYVGDKAGMPAAVTDFEDEVDRVAHTDMWVTLNRAGLERLKTEGFKFQSRDGGELLARAVAGARDEAVLVDLVKLGAPLSTRLDPDDRLRNERSLSLLDGALLNGMPALTDELISRGLLQSNGTTDARKLDVAFRAAVAGGRLALVEKIWEAGGSLHPSLTYLDSSTPGRGPGKPTPVTLLLSPERHEGTPWEGLALVKWLEGKGCDLTGANADGITLLHVAVSVPDLELTRYLLAHGLKDAPAGRGPSALQNARNEEAALLLLESGSLPPGGEAGAQYRAYIDTQHWSRVAAWLKAHTR